MHITKSDMITTREEYDYCVSRGFEPLVDERFPMENSLRVQIQREKFGKNNAEGNEKFYKFCLRYLPLVCKNCGKTIRNPSAFNVSHILSRGSHPEMSHDCRNVYILCPECHEMYEQKTTRRSMNIFDKSEKRIELLKQEYGTNHNSKNEDSHQ